MPLDPEAVSSLPQVIAQRNGPLSLSPAQHLPMWLPGFTAPDGWTPASSGDVPTTQMLVRRLHADSQWDGCEILNLYAAPATDGQPTTVLRVNYVTKFYYGDPAVVVTLDGAGVGKMLAAVQTAVAEGSSVLEHDGVLQEFRIEDGAADIDLQPTHTVWRLDLSKAVEIGEYLKTLVTAGSGHQYVDMVTPAETLILSRDEYVGIVFPWEQPGSAGVRAL